MPPATTYPDIELAVCQALTAQFPDLTADTVAPDVWSDDNLPFARVICHGGGDNRVTDTSRLTIDYFDKTRVLAQPGVEAVRQFITSSDGLAAGVPVDIGSTDVKPQDIPWNDANYPRRFTYSCSVAARRATS